MNAPKRSVILRFLCIISGCNHQTFIKTIYILDNVICHYLRELIQIFRLNLSFLRGKKIYKKNHL